MAEANRHFATGLKLKHIRPADIVRSALESHARRRVNRHILAVGADVAVRFQIRTGAHSRRRPYVSNLAYVSDVTGKNGRRVADAGWFWSGIWGGR